MKNLGKKYRPLTPPSGRVKTEYKVFNDPVKNKLSNTLVWPATTKSKRRRSFRKDVFEPKMPYLSYVAKGLTTHRLRSNFSIDTKALNL